MPAGSLPGTAVTFKFNETVAFKLALPDDNAKETGPEGKPCPDKAWANTKNAPAAALAQHR